MNMLDRTPPKGQCPICKTDTLAKWRPFCSKRCADIDLGRWMTGKYAVPAEEDPEPPELEDQG